MATKLEEWRKYSKYHEQVLYTSFIPFKMPIEAANGLENEKLFNIDELLTDFDSIGLIIDLTNNLRTYRIKRLKKRLGIDYINIPCDAKVSSGNWSKFVNTCADFIAQHPQKLIAVHCWTGTRQTGFMICKYLIEVCGQPMDVAIQLFKKSRGHNVDGLFTSD